MIQRIRKFYKTNKKLFQNLFFALVSVIYYLPFANRGLIFFDEGYIIHLSQRIVQGEIPYYNFFDQYTPGFFYLIAFFFKFFSVNVIVARLLTLSIASLIILFTLVLLDKLGFGSLKTKTSAFVILIAYGFPLFNIPIVVWPCILIIVISMIIFNDWIRSKKYSLKYPAVLGIVLALLFFTKHNLGLIYIAFINFSVLVINFESLKKKITDLAVLNVLFVIISIPWIYFFLIRSGDLSTFLWFSKEFVSYPFSYPSLIDYSSATKIFKIFPYYAPIIFGISLILSFVFKKIRTREFIILSFPLFGFALTVYPIGDIVHVYPFLGLSLVTLLILSFYLKPKVRYLIFIFGGITVALGFYLTFYKPQYKYGVSYNESKYSIDLPATKGMLVDSKTKKEIEGVNNFIQKKTNKNDYILVFPFSPMYYLLLDRRNPTAYENMLPGNIPYSEEIKSIEEIKSKNVKYFILSNGYKFDTPLSHWIQKNTKTVRVIDSKTKIAEMLGE